MKSLLTFDTLITPKFIKFFFYVGVFFCFLSGFGTFLSILLSCITAAQASGSSSALGAIGGLILGLIVGLIVTLVGIVLARVSSELTLVVFMIRDELAWQRENATKSSSSAS
ncbi:hypothetical protein HK27_02455 [Acetobacter orientalis]|uniref:DUF4282 domain-containing protein n=1 Tax=Acetobacter orientalis TaxID=146474 RepID=A0A252C7A1_9PROT|nr:DUF4282 domain-containing protein [Acetobacter orientalis]MDN6041532.1 DUF4282 domain-containing protein [Acetobacter sp.]MCP1215977.1 DUF4282 domain-containing protein [Acetobacter orientalis]MCP1217863.1 DUF4282 domain-containing protein [Acetobacter orientalis]MCP1221513.1 DUF4282 domain-containing protein [Acetobacter orientalis]OUI79580.1 hypothetical protein HK12_13665 [Acetobacter orientalis]